MIRIVIERKILANKIDEYHELIRNAKNKASNIAGFLSGEIFKVLDEGNHLVVMACWDSLEAWEAWAGSEHRANLLDAMRPLLEEEERLLILESSNLK